MLTRTRAHDITTAAAAVTSSVMLSRFAYDTANSITIFAPVGAEASTIEVTADPDAASPVWVKLRQAGADVAGPASVQAIAFTTDAPAFRLAYAVGVGAARTYQVYTTSDLT